MVDSDAMGRSKADFERDGYIVIRGFFPPDRARELRGAVDRYLDDIVPTLSSEFAYYEDKGRPETLFRLERMQMHDPFFEALSACDEMASLAARLLDDDAVFQNVEMFGKAPRIGAPTPPHQDGYYFMIEPNEGLTFWIPVDRATEENGCIRYVPGSHRRGMRPHGKSEVFGFSQGITDFGVADESAEVAVCVEPGDLIAHHSLTIHRTDANPSDATRRALGIVYYAARARKDERIAAEYGKKLHTEWQEAGKL